MHACMSYRILQERDCTLSSLFGPIEERLRAERERIAAGGEARVWRGRSHPNRRCDPHVCPHDEQIADGVDWGLVQELQIKDWRQYEDLSRYERLNRFARMVPIGELRMCLK